MYVKVYFRSTVHLKEQFVCVTCAIGPSVITTPSVSCPLKPCPTLPHFLSLEFEEPEEPNSRSFFSEIIGTISDVKFSHNGRYLLSRDYLTVKVWDLHMENKPIMSFQVHYLIYFISLNRYFSYFFHLSIHYFLTRKVQKIGKK